jgi:hypothetical protein
MSGRKKRRVMAEMPLAEDRRGVAERLENLGDEDLFGVDPEAGPMVERSSYANAVRITSRQERSARGGADGLSDVKVREANSLGRHPVKMGSPILRGSERTDIRVPQIIGIDENDVR